MPTSVPKPKSIPRRNGLQHPENIEPGRKAILEYLKDTRQKPGNVSVTLYLKRLTAQCAIYHNPILKFYGVYIPLEICSDPPAGTILYTIKPAY